MGNMFQFLTVVDSWLVAQVERGFVWVSDWTGMSRRRALQLLVALYVGVALWSFVLEGRPGAGWSLFALALLIWILLQMIRNAGTPSADQPLLRLLALESVMLRLAQLVFVLAMGRPLLQVAVLLVQEAIYCLLWYLVVGEPREPRRRGKQALDKVLEIFGTGWMPAPQRS